jgi:hypothetical protein
MTENEAQSVQPAKRSWLILLGFGYMLSAAISRFGWPSNRPLDLLEMNSVAWNSKLSVPTAIFLVLLVA